MCQGRIYSSAPTGGLTLKGGGGGGGGEWGLVELGGRLSCSGIEKKKKNMDSNATP